MNTEVSGFRFPFKRQSDSYHLTYSCGHYYLCNCAPSIKLGDKVKYPLGDGTSYRIRNLKRSWVYMNTNAWYKYK